MNLLLSRWLGRTPDLTLAANRPAPAGAADGDEDAPRSCGWFDSSHELQCGLWVREHASPDEVANELPLASWLELHLAGWQASPRA